MTGSLIPVYIICGYLALLLGLGLLSSRLFRGTSEDYMVASHSIGPFLLLMSIFGTTMTAFALVGSSGEAFKEGIGVYGMLASSSGIVHSLVFFVVGVRLWHFGKRYGYMTQIEFFRDRLENQTIGLLLFPVLVSLVVPYLLIGVISSGTVINGITQGAFEPYHLFAGAKFGVPPWLGSLVICCVVLMYVFFGGMRGTAWANTFQTIVFMVLGVVTFFMISQKLGGLQSATQAVVSRHPDHITRAGISQLTFFTYLLVPLSVGMFPHLFQHWLTARSASSFKLPIVAHPIFILIVWVPCVLVGIWATSAMIDGHLVVPPKANPNAVLAIMVKRLAGPVLSGFLTAGILAAIMSSLDSQFLCLGTMFTNDIVLHYAGADRFSERQKVAFARLFIVAIVALTYGFSLMPTRRVFTLGIWCFSGFSSLFPLVVAAIYWKRLTAAGAMASVVTVIVVWGTLFRQSAYGGNPHYTFLGMMPVVTIFASSAVALVLISLITRPPSEATIRKFFQAGASV